MSSEIIINTTSNETYIDYEDIDLIVDGIDANTKLLIQIVLFVPIYSLTFLVGLIGNSLVIFSICTVKSLHNITNIFLISLATADLLLIIICVPLKVCIHFFYMARDRMKYHVGNQFHSYLPLILVPK